MGPAVGSRQCLPVLVAVALLAGCGGGGATGADPPGLFAGYSEGEAVSNASYVLRSLLADPSSPLFQKELESASSRKER